MVEKENLRAKIIDVIATADTYPFSPSVIHEGWTVVLGNACELPQDTICYQSFFSNLPSDA